MTRSRHWYPIAPSYAVGDAEALIPVITRTCYPIDESGLLRETPVKEHHKRAKV
jgi:hypothetical protein